MYSVTRSFGLNGLSGFAVAVEADISGGLPAFSIVGLPDSAVRESADRVRAAIKNLASSSRTGALPSILPRRMCARPARCTTCRFCWQCSLPAASWRMCLRRGISGRTGTGRHPAAGFRRAAHGAGCSRKWHPRPVCTCRECRRSSRGLCRQHGRLPRPHGTRSCRCPARHLPACPGGCCSL